MSCDPASPSAPETGSILIERLAPNGDGLAQTPAGHLVAVPFVLPGERVQLTPASPAARSVPELFEPSPDRVEPACLHFGTCGGCQYQMAAYPAQLTLKRGILLDLLSSAGLTDVPPVEVVASPEPYGYRDRIRLRAEVAPGTLRLGYSLRGTNDFLPITMCPIAAPLLLRAAAALQEAFAANRDLQRLLPSRFEAELFCDAGETRLQLTLLTPARLTADAGAFARALLAVQALCPELSGAGLVRVDPRSGRSLETLASWGQPGLPYVIPTSGSDETYWVTRGGFFQVNRFLIPALIDLVCAGRSGTLAWDLFAGVGLFSRILARNFAAVTAVEANPVASADLRRAFGRLGPAHRAVEATTLDFLRSAILDRDRPDLIVLDPPRAGAGEEACQLLARLAPPTLVYLSCDPTTLARDLAILTRSGYRLETLHLIDLFPQTSHLESLAVLRRA